jgi:hypothetical protein
MPLLTQPLRGRIQLRPFHGSAARRSAHRGVKPACIAATRTHGDRKRSTHAGVNTQHARWREYTARTPAECTAPTAA